MSSILTSLSLSHTGLSICWLPIRLDCDHLFCIRCMIKMQNRQKRFCPLCRADVIQRANESMLSLSIPLFHESWSLTFHTAHIDMELVRYLERWFPKETKEKQRNNEDERRKELLGDLYVEGAQPPCIVM